MSPIPEEILNRKKKPLNTSVKSWFNKGLSDLVDNTLSETRIKRAGLFNKDYIDHLVKNKELIIWGRKYRYQILKLLFFELWFSIFIDDCDGRFNSKDPREGQVISPI